MSLNFIFFYVINEISRNFEKVYTAVQSPLERIIYLYPNRGMYRQQQKITLELFRYATIYTLHNTVAVQMLHFYINKAIINVSYTKFSASRALGWQSGWSELCHPREVLLYVTFGNWFIALWQGFDEVLSGHREVQLFLGQLFDLFRLESGNFATHGHHRRIPVKETHSQLLSEYIIIAASWNLHAKNKLNIKGQDKTYIATCHIIKDLSMDFHNEFYRT